MTVNIESLKIIDKFRFENRGAFHQVLDVDVNVVSTGTGEASKPALRIHFIMCTGWPGKDPPTELVIDHRRMLTVYAAV